jgi:hypothetical protein
MAYLKFFASAMRLANLPDLTATDQLRIDLVCGKMSDGRPLSWYSIKIRSGELHRMGFTRTSSMASEAATSARSRFCGSDAVHAADQRNLSAVIVRPNEQASADRPARLAGRGPYRKAQGTGQRFHDLW